MKGRGLVGFGVALEGTLSSLSSARSLSLSKDVKRWFPPVNLLNTKKITSNISTHA